VLRAILFDFNGVLVDDEPIHFELLRQVLAEEGYQLEQEGYFSRLLGVPDREALAHFLRERGEEPSAERLSRLVARKAAYYQQRMWRQGFPIVPGAPELISSAAAAGLPLGVVSGALRDEIEMALEQMGLAHCFKTIVAAEDVQAGKPDPEGYRRGLRELNSLPPLPARLLHPHEVLAIEDAPAGIAAAAAAGLSTLGLAKTYSAGALGGADRVVESLAGMGLESLRALFSPGP
jgi:beta-phosphoglucomutase